MGVVQAVNGRRRWETAYCGGGGPGVGVQVVVVVLRAVRIRW